MAPSPVRRGAADIEEKDPEVIKANQQVLRENSEDPAKAKTWLMRSSLLDSVRKEETIE